MAIIAVFCFNVGLIMLMFSHTFMLSVLVRKFISADVLHKRPVEEMKVKSPMQFFW